MTGDAASYWPSAGAKVKTLRWISRRGAAGRSLGGILWWEEQENATLTQQEVVVVEGGGSSVLWVIPRYVAPLTVECFSSLSQTKEVKDLEQKKIKTTMMTSQQQKQQ